MGLLDEEPDEPGPTMMTRKKVGKGQRKTKKPLQNPIEDEVNNPSIMIEEEEKEEVRAEPKLDPYLIAEQIRLENEAVKRQMEADAEMARDLAAVSSSEEDEESSEEYEDPPLPGMLQN